MKPIPNVLECAYCKRNYTHGGECHGKDFNSQQGCLGFKADERGCIRNKNVVIEVPIFSPIPQLFQFWDRNYQIDGRDTEIYINKIYMLSWDKQRGLLLIHCNCNYYINEFADDFKESTGNNKPVLRAIEGGVEK